jgi:predicted nucleic acid-binding protein
MRKILLDTDIVIWLLRKNETYTNTFIEAQNNGNLFLLSPIVSAEIYAGAFKKEYHTIEQLFNFFEPLALDTYTGKIAGEYANKYRKSHHTISLEDYLLAATAKQEKALLWTGNRKHYPMSSDIEFYGTLSDMS